MTRPAVVFGDVHGDAFRLKVLVRKVRERFGHDVDLYTCGDLVDRGPDSKGVIEICVREKIRGVYGNHEQWLRDYLQGRGFNDFALRQVMGGKATLRSYGFDTFSAGEIERELQHRMPEEHKQFLLALQPYLHIQVGGQPYWLIHAGMRKDTAIGYGAGLEAAADFSDEKMMAEICAISEDTLLWSNPDPQSGQPYAFQGGAVQIFGHQPVPTPMVTGHFIALDTGCSTCAPNVLSAVILPSHEIIQVK